MIQICSQYSLVKGDLYSEYVCLIHSASIIIIILLSDRSCRTTPPPLSLAGPSVSEVSRALGRYCDVVQPTQLADIDSEDIGGEDSTCMLCVMRSPPPPSVSSPYRVLKLVP